MFLQERNDENRESSIFGVFRLTPIGDDFTEMRIQGSAMLLKVAVTGLGLHPSERVISISTAEGVQEIVVNESSIRQGTIEIGNPITSHGKDLHLVELPTETNSGAWRVWVRSDQILWESMEAAE